MRISLFFINRGISIYIFVNNIKDRDLDYINKKITLTKMGSKC